MQNNSILFKNIENLGTKYTNKHLSGFDKNKQQLECNWWEALKFFFWHSFMRGRRDELSEQYGEFAIDGLKEYFNINESNLKEGYLKVASDENKKYYKDAKKIKKKKIDKKDPQWIKLVEKNPIVRRLVDESRVRKIENKEEYNRALGNTGDIVMVLEVLEFIAESENKKNIYHYMKNKLKEGSVGKLYEELKSIKYIGDKIATFIIRDIYLLNPPPELGIQESDYENVFPVDTWVNKLAEKLECKGSTTEQTKKMLINKVNENKLDVCKFAAGLWYLGAGSLDILLDHFISKFDLR